MDRVEKAKKIRRILNKLYPDPAIPLLHTDSYSLLIAVYGCEGEYSDARAIFEGRCAG